MDFSSVFLALETFNFPFFEFHLFFRNESCLFFRANSFYILSGKQFCPEKIYLWNHKF